jgi:hypothetical protein
VHTQTKCEAGLTPRAPKNTYWIASAAASQWRAAQRIPQYVAERAVLHVLRAVPGRRRLHASRSGMLPITPKLLTMSCSPRQKSINRDDFFIAPRTKVVFTRRRGQSSSAPATCSAGERRARHRGRTLPDVPGSHLLLPVRSRAGVPRSQTVSVDGRSLMRQGIKNYCCSCKSVQVY